MFKVPLTQIIDIKPHDNVDRLAIGVVYDFNEAYLDDETNTDLH